MKKLVIITFVFLMMLGTVAAQCEIDPSSDNTRDFLREIPTINSALQTCPIEIPSFPGSPFNNERIIVDISMRGGGTESIVANIQNGFLQELTWGGTGTGLIVETTECAMDTVLRSENGLGVMAYLYKQGDLTITGASFGKRIALAIARPFLSVTTGRLQTPTTVDCTNPDPSIGPQVPGSPTGKPDNCEDTFLPGHREYADNKELWDGYSLNTDGVCQINRGGPERPCAHLVQLSISGMPYYLCWYNN